MLYETNILQIVIWLTGAVKWDYGGERGVKMSLKPAYGGNEYSGTGSAGNLGKDWNRFGVEFITNISLDLENISGKQEGDSVSNQLRRIIGNITGIPNNSSANLADIQGKASRQGEKISKMLFGIDFFNTKVSDSKIRAALEEAGLIEDGKITEDTLTIASFIDIIDIAKSFNFSTKGELVAHLSKQDQYESHPFVQKYKKNHKFAFYGGKFMNMFSAKTKVKNETENT